MNDEDKVERLRDAFEEVTGSTEVHEEGSSERGKLKSDEELRVDVREVVEEVEERYGLPEAVDVAEAVDVVFAFYGGAEDAEIAESVSADEPRVEEVRHALCLVRDDEDVSPETEARDEEGRYSIRFESLFTETDISGRLTEGVEESGLREATEDSEVDTEF